MIFRYCRNFRRTFFSRAADGPLGGETDFPLFPLVRYPLLEFSLGVPVLSPQVGPKPCLTVFRPFMTVFDRLFGADRPRNSRRIKHSSVFRPLAHGLKTAKTVKTAPLAFGTAPRIDQNSSCSRIAGMWGRGIWDVSPKIPIPWASEASQSVGKFWGITQVEGSAKPRASITASGRERSPKLPMVTLTSAFTG